MTEVCAFVIVLGLIPDIVGFVSATPVKLLPSTAGKVAGKTSSTNLPEPFKKHDNELHTLMVFFE